MTWYKPASHGRPIHTDPSDTLVVLLTLPHLLLVTECPHALAGTGAKIMEATEVTQNDPSSCVTSAVGAMPAPAPLVHEDKPNVNAASQAPNLKFPLSRSHRSMMRTQNLGSGSWRQPSL